MSARRARPGALTRFLREHLVAAEHRGTDLLIEGLRHVRRRGYFSRAEFLAMCRWKSPRAIARCRANRARTIRETSRQVFLARDEARRLSLLAGLEGVGIPTASAILTLTDPRRYGVLDIRAWQQLHRLGEVQDRPAGQGFRSEHWLQYLAILRREAKALGVGARQVEYSLFTFHERHQEGRLYRRAPAPRRPCRGTLRSSHRGTAHATG